MLSAKESFGGQMWRVVGSHIRYAVLFSALVNILYLAPTIYMIQVYDRVVPTRGVPTLLFITVVILFALATLSLLDQMRNTILQRAAIALDEAFGARLIRMTLTARPGEAQQQQVMRDFDLMKAMLASPVLGALFDLPWAPIYVIVATIIHPLIGLATVIGAGLLLTLAIRNDRATRAAVKTATERATSTYFAQEAVGGSVDTIRALGMREALVSQYVGARLASAAPGRASARTSGRYSGAIKFIRLALQSVALGIGAYLAINDMISSGAIISASVLMSRSLAPIDQVVSGWRAFGDARNAFAHVSEFWAKTPEAEQRTALPRPEPLLQVEGVSIVSPMKDRFILNNISFAVDRPAIVAVVGPSGSGKSTLLQLLANARDPDRGAVRLDGAKHGDWDAEELARHVGFLPQDSMLVSGTIKDNISRFQSQLGDNVDAFSVDAAKRAGAHDMVLRLPNGYDTVLGPRGRGLSAGQQQRVALARALYGDPLLLVLDEPYSALDQDSEARLMHTLAALRTKGAIVVVAAHKTAIVAASDYLVVLQDGALQSFGPTKVVVDALNKAAQVRQEVVPTT